MSASNIIKAERVHDGYLKVDKVTVDNDGQPVTNNVATAKDGVIVVLYDPKVDKVLLIEEVRPAIALHAQNNPQLYTAATRPSGRLISCVLGGAKPGQSFAAAARQEAAEESGSEVTRLKKGARFFPCASVMSSYVDIYVAEIDVAKVKNGDQHGIAREGEAMTNRVYTITQLNRLINQKSLQKSLDATSYRAVDWFLKNRETIRKNWLDSSPSVKSGHAKRPKVQGNRPLR